MKLIKYILTLLILISSPIQLSAMDNSNGMEEIKKKKKKKKGKKVKGKEKGKKGSWGIFKKKWKQKKEN
jgi:hypothetical protein|tara:strand:+ start:2154 stop:2360 length:207 start_codon:yes stop_codon:yes gene_type:complete